MTTGRTRPLATAAAVMVGLVVLAGAWAFIQSRSQAIVEARHPLDPSPVAAATTPEAVARGGRLVAVTACGGCHGPDLTGGPLNVAGTQVPTPNLTRLASRQSDAELDRAIRRGLRPDGTSELVMPSAAYAGFTDDEVAAMIGYLRSLPGKGVQPARPHPGPFLRVALVAGWVRPDAEAVLRARPPLDAGPAVAAGRHLAAIACGRCHGTDLGGVRDAGPDMTVRGYFTPAQFHTLLRKGEAVGAGNMALMNETAQASFSHFTDGEIDAIYAYLDARDRILAARAARRKTS